MTQQAILNIIAAVVLVAVVTLLENAVNLRRERRSQQVYYPAVAALYSVVMIVLALLFGGKTASVFSGDSPLKNAEVAAANLLLMLGFVLVKALALIITSKASDTPKRPRALMERYYFYDAGTGRWYLKSRWLNFRQLVLGCVVAGVIVSGVILGLVWALGAERGTWLYVFPCAAQIVLNEISNFLGGQTRDEQQTTIRADASCSSRISVFSRVQGALAYLFPAQLLSSHMGCEFMRSEGVTNVLKTLSESEDRIDRITAAHFALREASVLNPDAVRATTELMHRKSVLFFTPFYRDVGDYVALPLVDTLISDKKCLIITSRASVCGDMKAWITELLDKYCKVHSLWSVGCLDERASHVDVGILSFGQLYNLKMLESNREFFHRVDFVLLLEPSLIVNTAQIALNIIMDEIAKDGGAPIYCVCDRPTNGLVDTMSHLLCTEIVEVSATPVPRSTYTAMAWDADGDYGRQRIFDKQTRYLGNGTELAAVAIRNQIPRVTWFSETKAPVRDIKWIDGQFYATLCRYMNISSQQKALDEKLTFVSNLWCAPSEKEQFLIVEDEFCNMFATMSLYLSRTAGQIFVNVLSEDYLLRDYMRCNRELFMSNPNAVPSLVPDYVKSERNTIIKLIITMSYRALTEEQIRTELALVGIETNDVFATLTKLICKYTDANDGVLTVKNFIRDDTGDDPRTENCFSIAEQAFDQHFASTLKNAYYVVENEKATEYVDAKLFGHITQCMLPGQFVTYEGKYYEVKRVSPQVGVVLHRASDLYDARKYYRQLRTYHLAPPAADAVISTRKVIDIELTKIRCSFRVSTSGYLEMRSNHDLKTARVIDFSADKMCSELERSYKNKAVLRIRFPDMEQDVRFTVCLLLSEVLRSVLPNGWQYIAVTLRYRDDVAGMLNHMVYRLDGAVAEDDPYIYIIEDSALDLGLLEAVERKLPMLFELILDYLEWHTEKLREPRFKDPVYDIHLPEQEAIAVEKEKEATKKRGWLARKLRALFGLDKHKEEEPAEEPAAEPTAEPAAETPSEAAQQPDGAAPSAEPSPDGASAPELDPEAEGEPLPEHAPETDDPTAQTEDAAQDELLDTPDAPLPAGADAPAAETDAPTAETDAPADEQTDISETEDSDVCSLEGTDIFEDEEGAGDGDLFHETLFEQNDILPIPRSRYQRECFLKFGFEDMDSRLRVKETVAFLRARGLGDNDFTKARKRQQYTREEQAQQQGRAVNRCDFCRCPITGVSYERLTDGRIRCNDCAASAITTEEEFRDLFRQTVDMMQALYHIDFDMPIQVLMTDANNVARGTGRLFVPSQEYASRVVGFARYANGQFGLVVENGAPRIACIATVAHEMTHIWQYRNWGEAQKAALAEKYGPGRRTLIMEGMAMWAEIQLLYSMGETYQAHVEAAETLQRDDVYGVGFRLFCNEYPLVHDGGVVGRSPFLTFPPLEIDLGSVED